MSLFARMNKSILAFVRIQRKFDLRRKYIFRMKLLFFGPLADIAGKTKYDLSQVQNTDELKKKLFEKHPELVSHTFLVAVNKKVQQKNVALKIDDEVALLPPFSGG